MPLAIAGWLTGANVERWDPFDTILFDRLAALKMRDSDVLHGWSGYSLRSGNRAKRRGAAFILERSCPHVDSQESLLEGEAERLHISYRRKPDFWMERSRAEYALADYIVVPSSYSLRSFVERGFDPMKIVRAPLDFPVLYRGRPAPTQRPEEFVVGTLGGNVLRKGFLYLLEAWKKLRLPNARLLIKSSEAELRRSPPLREYLDRCTNVEVVGYVDDISSFYRRCDVFCLASVDDGFGLAMVEALANGVPTVVTENVGASELLHGANVGYVVPIRNADALSEKILLLYESRELRARMAENALQFAERLTKAPGGYFDTIRDLYERVTLQRGPEAVTRHVVG
jgi:glycosyltransferase involved in cell wall biosynthesis